MKFILIKSENSSKKPRNNKKIKFIIIHYTGMQSKRVSVDRLRSLKHKVSCHYLIDRKGNIVQMVEDNKIAWHAGKSKWGRFKNLNNSSIGIELVNKGHRFGYQKFSTKQLSKLVKLGLFLKKKYKINNKNILGHSDIAPLRKIDPGEKFPWKKLTKKGLGVWYLTINKNTKVNISRNIFFSNLYKIGYRYFNKKISNSINDKLIIKVFQMRFLPEKVDGKIDQKTYKISQFLSKKYKN